MSSDNKKTSQNPLAEPVSLGLQLAVGMIFCIGAGYYFDQKWQKGPVFSLMGMVLGFIYCGYEIWKTLRQTNNQDFSERKK